MKRCTIQPIPITNQIAILQKKKSWYQCSTEYESDISEGSDSEYEFYKARRRVPLHRNDIVRLREPLGASQHLSDCVQRPSSKLEAATDQITRLAGFGSSCMREICERKNYEDHLDKVRKEVEKENMRPVRLVPLAGVHQDELRAVRKKIATKGKEAKR